MQLFVSIPMIYITIRLIGTYGTSAPVKSSESGSARLGISTEGHEYPEPFHSMPEKIDSVFDTRLGRTHLRLKQHHSCNHLKVNTATQRYKDCSAKDIPVYTHQDKNNSQDAREVRLDNFPRLYANYSRTYRDGAHDASFLVVHNPVFNTFKFFGSLRIGGEQYIVQPSTLNDLNIMETNDKAQSSNGLHLLSKSPTLKYSADHMGLFLQGNPLEGSSNTTWTSTRSPTSSIAVTISVNTGYAGATPPQLISEDMETKDSNETEGALDLAEILRRQKKYWYHKSLEHFMKPTLSTTTTEIPDDPIDEKVVEVFIVCDYLCYKRFQDYFKVTDSVATKNAITQYFAYVRDFAETAYSGLYDDYPELGLAVDIRVVGLYIATKSSHKVIGDYVIGDNNEVDSVPSLFEFVLWVEDTLKPHIKADHYSLVTGYDLSGESNFVLGLVSNIPSVCQLDSVSLAELWLPITASVMTHELGHSLGADHDGLTNGFCQDEQQFIMAAVVGGAVPEENVGNGFRFSNCSALFFQAALRDKECLKQDNFTDSPLPSTAPPVGQVFTLDEQCAALVNNSYTCRENISVSVGDSWDGICSNNLCRLPQAEDTCFEMVPLQFTSCGNKSWCVDGVCVEDADAPEKPIDCPAGDSAQLSCNATRCASGEYDDVTRFVSCCETCQPLKTERFVLISSSV